MFSEFYNLHFPLVNPSRFNINTTPLNPFMTDSLLRCRIKKEELARIKKNNPSPINILTFNNYRNVYKSTCKTAKKLFYQHSFVNCQGDSKKIWSCLKSTMGLPPKSNNIKHLIIDDVIVDDNLTIANAFNTHFSKIGASLANSMPGRR